MNKKCVFIGGTKIGVLCLKQLLKQGIFPDLIIANIEDRGEESSEISLVSFTKEKDLTVLKAKKLTEKDVLEKIRKINPEIIFCIGSYQLIPKDILHIPSLGVLNIHPALLPRYRGRYSNVWAIFNGEKETGVTLHFMDEGIDSGPIIMQKSYPLTPDMTAKDAYDKFVSIGSELFAEFLKKWIRGEKILSKPQDNKKATYYPKGLPNGGKIDWSWKGEKIYNFIKALTFEPFPPPYFNIGKKKMIIIDEKYLKSNKKI